MNRNMTEWRESLRAAERKKAMPLLSFPGIQILNVPVHDLVFSGELQAKCMEAIAKRYSMAAAVSTMDLSIEAEAFGTKVRFSDEEIPTVLGHLVDDAGDARDLQVPKVGAGRTGEAIQAISKALDTIDDRPIFAGVIGPYSLAGRLMGMTEVMINCMIEPGMVHAVLQKATSFLIDYIEEFKKIGADGIVMAEPAAGLLSPDLCMEFSSRYVRQIVDAAQDDSFLVVYHNCGNTLPLIEATMATGAKVIHLGNAVDIADVIGKYPPDTIIMGNVDPAGEFRNGTPESISEATDALLRRLSGYPNWVISSGCDIPPMTPLRNIDAFFKTVEEFYTMSGSRRKPI